MSLLFVPDRDALQRKLEVPPPLLSRLYGRFRDRLVADPARGPKRIVRG